MKKTIFLVMTLCMSAGAKAFTKIACNYKMYGMDFSRIEIRYQADGTLEPLAWINFQGREHTESATPETKAAGELEHLWISKESSENSLEMIIYQEPQKQGRSRLINPHIPIGSEMWGECQFD